MIVTGREFQILNWTLVKISSAMSFDVIIFCCSCAIAINLTLRNKLKNNEGQNVLYNFKDKAF